MGASLAETQIIATIGRPTRRQPAYRCDCVVPLKRDSLWNLGRCIASLVRAASQPPERRGVYDKLEHLVIPTFYQGRDRFVEMIRHCIALNGSFFNTHRMIQQYILKAYFG